MESIAADHVDDQHHHIIPQPSKSDDDQFSTSQHHSHNEYADSPASKQLSFSLKRRKNNTNNHEAEEDVVDVVDESEADSETKRQNQPKKDNPAEKKKKPFERFWSEKDELRLLRRLKRFCKKNGCDATKVDMAKFYADAVSSMPHLEFNKSQLVDKVRRLRNKFVRKYSANPDWTYSNARDQKVFEYSKKLWRTTCSDERKVKQEPNLYQVHDIAAPAPAPAGAHYFHNNRDDEFLEMIHRNSGIPMKMLIENRTSFVGVARELELRNKFEAFEIQRGSLCNEIAAFYITSFKSHYY